MTRPARRLMAVGALASIGFAGNLSGVLPAIVASSPPTSTASAGGFHTCALTTTGSVRCWGDNEFGELGNGTLVAARVPGSVIGLAGVRQVTSGQNHCEFRGSTQHLVECL
jgi:Regulator of chromosome condensation (RCC1) repeat